jgi:MFS transporter, FHS family, Na+ dependent glucose transporter 1
MCSPCGPCLSKKSHIERMKIVISCAYFSAFFGLGFCLAIIGPSMLELSEITGEGLGAMGTVFTWRAVGYLCGTLVGGQAFEKYPGEPLLTGSSLLAGVGTLFIPHCRSLVSLGLAVASQGVAMGFLDTGGNVLLLRLHADPTNPSAADPFMNTMHFFFALGAFFIPLIMDLFDSMGANFSASYTLTGCYMFSVAIALCFLSWYVWKTDFYVEKQKAIAVETVGGVFNADKLTSASSEAATPSAASQTKGKRRFSEKLLFFSTGALLFVYVGAESTYGGLLYTYVVTNVGFSNSQGKAVTSIYWGMLAIGRAVAVPLSMKFTPVQLLMLDMVGCSVASLILLMFPQNPLVYWIMSGVYGLSMASVFPTAINAAAYFTTVDGPAASAIVVGASLGDMSIPLGTAVLFVVWGGWSFPAIMFSLAIASFFAFLVMVFLGRRVQQERQQNTSAAERNGLEMASV